jgi:hypothetical protein
MEEVFRPLIKEKFLVKKYRNRLILEIHFKDKSRLYFSWNLNSLVENDNYSLKYSRYENYSVGNLFLFPPEYQKCCNLEFIFGQLCTGSQVLRRENFNRDLIGLNLKNLEKRIKQINRQHLILWLFVCKYMGFWIKDLKIYLFEKFLVIK